MSTALAKAQDSAVAVAGADPFAVQGTEGSQGTTYMKFTGNTGNFTAGQDDEEIEHGTQFAADMMNARYEWSFWWDGEIKETVGASLLEDAMLYDNEPNHLPDDPDIDMSLDEIREQQRDRSNTFMDGWSCQAVLGLRPVDGSSEEYTLKLNQGVALNAFHALRKSFGRQYKLKAGLIPIVELDANKFKSKAKNVGWRFAPVVKIIDWASEDDLAAMIGENPEAYEGGEGEAGQESAGADTQADAPEESPQEDEPKSARRGARGKRGNF